MRYLPFLILGAISISMFGCQQGSPAPSQVTGLIISITPQELGEGEVESFEVQEGEEVYEILIDPERDYGFDLFHLHEHQSDALRVIVDLEERDGALYAVTIEDA